MDIRNKNKSAKKSLVARTFQAISKNLNDLVKSTEIRDNQLIMSSEIKKKADLREKLLNDQKLLEEREKLLIQANSDLPIFFDKDEKLIVLEALLLARVRDEKPVADVIAAIELIKADVENLMPSKSFENKETIITHKYQIPVLSELGDVIYSMRRLILFTPVAIYLCFVAMLFLSPRTCETRVTQYGDFENKSSYCQMLMQFNRFFSDYQKIDESKK